MTDSPDDLITPHLPAVWRLARVLCRSAGEAEDLVQDAFLAAWRRRTDLRDPGAARAWLLRVTVNTHRDDRRRDASRRRRAERAAVDPSSPVGRAAAAAETPRSELGELQTLATRAMAELPERQREVLHLSAVEGLDHAAIARILNISPSNVGSTLTIARRRVAERLAAAATPGRATTPASPGARR
jgi:RNA polymerase sigma-70 factor (ECF subfamily)